MSTTTLIRPTLQKSIRLNLNLHNTHAHTHLPTRFSSSTSPSSSSSSSKTTLSPVTVMLYSYIAGSFTLPFVAPAVEKQKSSGSGSVGSKGGDVLGLHHCCR